MKTELRGMADNVIARCRSLAAFSEEPGQIKRTFLSGAMRDCMQTVQSWMEAAGMSVSIDAAGNLRGRYPGSSGRRFLLGSHLDTVPNSGAFDGVLGVLVGLALVEALGGEMLSIGVEVIAFSEEEGVRFSLPFIGSRAVVGRVDPAMLGKEDAGGISIERALTGFGLDAARLPLCILDQDVIGYLEFHIEQGAVLESRNLSLGVVEAIAGQTRAELIFTGQARHAGTTPMHLRHDAVCGAAEWIVAVEELARSTPGLVATTGNLHTHGGAGNVVAGEVRASLDVRHKEDSVRLPAFEQLLALARSIAQRRGLTVSCSLQMDQAAVSMDPSLSALAVDAIRSAGQEPLTMVSGAGHDAMILAERVPAAMIFLRSPSGISHHPDESVRVEDVEHAIAAGLFFLRQLASDNNQMSSKKQSPQHA